MAHIDVTVEVDPSDFDDYELIDEIESRGYTVKEESSTFFETLEREEKIFLLNLISSHPPGSIGYNLYNKILKE
jgi:hypothetical protein